MPINCRSLLPLLFVLLCLSKPSNAASAAPSPPATISELHVQARDAAIAKLTSRAALAGLADATIDVVIPPLRPPVPTCAVPFDFELGEARQLSRLVLTARCPGSEYKTRLVVRARITATVPVVSHDVGARQPITAEDLGTDRRSLKSLTGTITLARDAIGKVSRHALRQGQVLSREAFQAEELIHHGHSVRIVAHVGQTEIVNTGIAMQSGTKGSIIQLRVGDRVKGNLIEARVIGPGVAEPVGLLAPGSER
ncbi:flagellar basal body P-ring formation chaperone FlgA [Pandoraea apista]|uniref:flagellar basal body P-ring formation chaperone FlgA n=1 Tax=Pandoraea apista TaxID=93218 RepID=UPI000F6833CA|nr:flagellar basal body P-ring formation chaperone FlgA [Pandoraea apista]RRW88812.1 flagella basal body P-ring formation protein FlgA [Pandoraea apista]RRW98071.1 flagella basal body P-ring formation protein FlgA [Pandoraea apista]